MGNDRRLEVLRAIVEGFVATREPVGSKVMVDRYDLGVSSATVRNDMASLEEDGYIVQPHTSAGRVPTDKGYRLFVDRLDAVRPMSRAERNAIRTFLDPAVELDQVVERTVRLLSQITRQVAMVQYPSLQRSKVRHVELVPMGVTRILVVLIANTGRVDQRLIELKNEVDPERLARFGDRLNAAVSDREFADVSAATAQLQDACAEDDRELVTEVLRTLAEATEEETQERVVIGGAANLARYGHDFPDSVHPVLEALEEHVVLLRLLGEATATDEVSVRIGHENEVEGMGTASVVTVGYGPEASAIAHLGVVGPTRMDYPGNMAAVKAVARYLGRVLAEQ